MACYHPWVKDFPEGPRRLPCGQCVGCRLEHSRQWAVRIMHESKLHDQNSFLTLTYDDAHLPAYGSLDKRAFPLFMNRLRKEIGYERVRYFHCGEYGEKRQRPHYHAVLFGWDFSGDRFPVQSDGEFPMWQSPQLARLWPMGQCMIGSVSFESAAYVARYVVKKVTGTRAKEHYSRVDVRTGEVVELVPEFATMSRNPGIGAGWIAKYREEVYRHDEVIVGGVPCRPPRFYDQAAERLSPELWAPVEAERRLGVFRKPYERGAKRLRVREVCAAARLTLSKRGDV